MEKLYAGRLEDRYDALAHHFLEGNDTERGLEYSLKAGERAWEASSWERARLHFGTALDLFEKLPEDLPRQAQVLERLALIDTFMGRQGIGYGEKAVELFTRAGDKRKAARMHAMLAPAWSSGTAGRVDVDRAMSHREAAVSLLDAEPDSGDKEFAFSQFSLGLSQVLDLERALQQGQRALEIAEGLKDSNAVSRACIVLARVLAYRGELAQAEECAERSWGASFQSVDPWVKARAAVYPIAFWPWRNTRAWLEQWVERSLEYRQRSHLDRFDRPIYGVSALLSALSGRPQDAAEALRKAKEEATQRPYLHPYQEHFAGISQGILGDWEEAGHLVAGALEAAEHSHFLSQIVEGCTHYGRFLLAIGDTSRAEEVLIQGNALARDKRSIVQELNLLPLLVELHVRTGRLDQAQPYLKRAHEILAQPQPWGGLAAPVRLAEGLLASAKGDWLGAERAFSSSQEAERTYGFPYGEARVLFEWGHMHFTHLKRNIPGDRERGRELLGQALEIYKRCAAKTDIENVETTLGAE
jgi:tetratricopeptide (TPR) repeat protein